jgi:hypothetical protein
LLQFPSTLSTEIVDYLRAQMTDDVAPQAAGPMFSIATDYCGDATSSFLVVPTLSRLLRLRRRLPVEVIADAIREAIEASDWVFEESRSAAAQLNQLYDSGWRVQISRPSSVTVTVADKQITARLDGAGDESIDFGQLDVAAYTERGRRAFWWTLIGVTNHDSWTGNTFRKRTRAGPGKATYRRFSGAWHGPSKTSVR